MLNSPPRRHTVSSTCPGLRSPSHSPGRGQGGKAGWELRAGKAKRRKLLSGSEQFLFLPFLPKPRFRKITLCCLFLVTLASVRSCELYPASMAQLSFPGYLPRPAGVAQPVVAGRGHRRDPPAQPSVAGRCRHRASSGRTQAGHLTAAGRLVQLLTRKHRSVYRGPASRPPPTPCSRGAVPRGRLGLAGRGGVSVGGGGGGGACPEDASVGGGRTGGEAASLWLRPLECWAGRRFVEEPHLSIVTFTFFTFIYVFIRSFEYWYLLLKGSTRCFAVKLVLVSYKYY